MKRTVATSPAARRDLVEIAVKIAAEQPAAAERFLAAAEHAFAMLAEMPGMGRVRQFRGPGLTGLRSWPLRRFKQLVFYRVTEAGIEVVRVIHGARNLSRALRQ